MSGGRGSNIEIGACSRYAIKQIITICVIVIIRACLQVKDDLDSSREEFVSTENMGSVWFCASIEIERKQQSASRHKKTCNLRDILTTGQAAKDREQRMR